MSNTNQSNEVRICQQHCGHDARFYRLSDNPRAVDENKIGSMCWYEDEDGFCGHRCDFSVRVPDRDICKNCHQPIRKPEGEPWIHVNGGLWTCNTSRGKESAEPCEIGEELHRATASSTQPNAAKDSAEVRHLLQCLAEECAEVIQAVSKALRFGLDDDHQAANPDIVSPRRYVQKELNDVVAIADLLADAHVFPTLWVRKEWTEAKKVKLTKMMAYARKKGML